MKLKDAIKNTDRLRKYQYPSGRVLKIAMRYVPKTLQFYIQAEVASGSDKTKKYQVRLVFNQVRYSKSRSRFCTVPYIDLDRSKIWLEKPSTDHNFIVVCNCQDKRFMWHWHLADERAWGAARIPYQKVPGSNRGPVNPDEIPGLCKHTLQLIKKLITIKKLKADPFTVAYLNRPVR